MRCRNCGNTDRFVLLVEIAVVARGRSEFSEPTSSLSVECRSCASTDVAGDPAALLAAWIGSTDR